MPTPFGEKDDSAILRFRSQLKDALTRDRDLQVAQINAEKQRKVDMAINEQLQGYKDTPVNSYGDLFNAARGANVNLEQLGPKGQAAAKNVNETARLYREPAAQTQSTTTKDEYDWVTRLSATDKIEYENVLGKKLPVLKKAQKTEKGWIDTGLRKSGTAIGEAGDGSGSGSADPRKMKVNTVWTYTNVKGERVDHPLVGTLPQVSASLMVTKENLRKNVLSAYPFDLKAIHAGDMSSVEKFKAEKQKEIASQQELAANLKAEVENRKAEGGEESQAYKDALSAKEILDKKIGSIREFVENGETAVNAWRSAIQQEASINEMGGGVGTLKSDIGPAPIKQTAAEDYTKIDEDTLFSKAQGGDRKAYDEAKRRGLVK